MKKTLLISFGIIVTVILGLFVYTSYQYRSLNDRYVQLVPGEEDRIVIVDVGDGDREAIAQKIIEIAACKPAVIGVDLFFRDFDHTDDGDAMLKKVFWKQTVFLERLTKEWASKMSIKTFRRPRWMWGMQKLIKKTVLYPIFTFTGTCQPGVIITWPIC